MQQQQQQQKGILSTIIGRNIKYRETLVTTKTTTQPRLKHVIFVVVKNMKKRDIYAL
jgi:hypothetical protein